MHKYKIKSLNTEVLTEYSIRNRRLGNDSIRFRLITETKKLQFRKLKNKHISKDTSISMVIL